MTDIEKALAEGLAQARQDGGHFHYQYRPDSFTLQRVDASPEMLATALAATPSMQEVARRAAIGAAVKREFGDYFTKHEHDADAEWCLKHLPRPAAIAAATGEDEA